MKSDASKPAEKPSTLGERAADLTLGDRYRAPPVPVKNARTWLREFMRENGGVVAAAVGYEKALENGYKDRCISMARQREGIKTRQIGQFGPDTKWYWYDPHASHAKE
jgi:hypothetical protein